MYLRSLSSLSDLFDYSYENCMPTLSPRILYDSDDKNVYVKFEIPGVSHKEVDVKREGDSILVNIESKNTYNKKIKKYLSFDGTDASLTTAKLEKGILTITIPKIKKETQDIHVA